MHIISVKTTRTSGLNLSVPKAGDGLVMGRNQLQVNSVFSGAYLDTKLNIWILLPYPLSNILMHKIAKCCCSRIYVNGYIDLTYR